MGALGLAVAIIIALSQRPPPPPGARPVTVRANSLHCPSTLPSNARLNAEASHCEVRQVDQSLLQGASRAAAWRESGGGGGAGVR